MDNTADMLGLLTHCLAKLAGSGAADPGGNTANVTTVQALTASAQTLLSNPMTTSGDIIRGGTSGVPTRLATGTNGQILTLSGGIPAWVSPSAVASGIIQPTGDTTGAADAANINTALSAVAGTQGGGEAWLGPGLFYVNSTITVPHKSYIHGCGALTRILYLGTGPCFYMHDPVGSNSSNTVGNSSGKISDIIIDGNSNTHAGVTGLDIGDGWGYRLDHVYIESFTSGGGTCIGLRVGNDTNGYFTEKMRATHCIIRNCDTLVYMDTTVPSAPSHGYCDFEFYFYLHVNQKALTVASGVNLYGGSLVIRGNHDTATSAQSGWIVGLTGGSDISEDRLDIRMEGNQGNPFSATKLHFSGVGDSITDCYGLFNVTGAGGATDGTSGQFHFAGIVKDAAMQAIRTSPADGWFV